MGRRLAGTKLSRSSLLCWPKQTYAAPSVAHTPKESRTIYFTYDIMWREAMMELLDQLEAENPEDPALAPRELNEWACIYIKYIQIFRKLETAYDQMVHPQKRLDMKKALEGCMGRMLEIRHWMVKLNRGLDFINLDDILVDLKLSPDVLEVPVPKYFIEDRAKELDDRKKFLEALVEKYQQSSGAISNSTSSSMNQATSSTTRSPAISGGPPLPIEEAVAMVARNERGRQARERARSALAVKKQRRLEDKRSALGVALSSDEAVTRIQSCMRGAIWRKRVSKEADHELMFVHMKPKPLDARQDPQAIEARTLVARKRLQLEHLREYDDAVVALRTTVKEAEGQDMREAIQDKINAWFIEKRDPDTGEYPAFPDESDGGSKPILNPPLPSLESLLADEAEAAAGKGKKGGKAPAKKDDKKGSAGKKGAGKGDDAGEKVEEVVGSAFVPAIETAVAEYVARWQDKDERENFAQTYDAELAKEELRPLVFEEVRRQVDDEMRVLLSNLRDMVDAERAAKLGKKAKKKKGKKKGKKKDGKGKSKKGRKDPTADRSMESLFAELVSNGILVRCPNVHIDDYMGCYSYMGATLEKANIIPDPSMAQVRHAVTEYAILPLGSAAIHERAPFIRSMLLYGAEKTGKTMLSQAIASLSGANFFDLSPRNTDGRYPGKNVSMMMHMVFKVARIMAPSVIYIDEAEKVFISDKKKLKEFGSKEPYSRIKKELLKEAKALTPGDRVLLLGNSREPWLAAKKDEKAFMSFWNKSIFLPPPDYASRRLIWPGLFERYGGRLGYEFDLSTLAHISEGYAAGSLDAVVGSMMTRRRLERLRMVAVDIPEILQWLSRVQPVSRDVDEELRRFTDKMPAVAAIKGGKAEKATVKKEKGGDAKKKKK